MDIDLELEANSDLHGEVNVFMASPKAQ